MDLMSEISKVIDLPADIIMRYRYTVFGGRAVYVAGQKGLKFLTARWSSLDWTKKS